MPPPKPSFVRFSIAVISLCVLAACASAPGPHASVQPAADLPAQFQVQQADGSTRAPQAGEGCRNPLIDPGNQAHLLLQQSRDGWGDYSVPAGHYGAAANQWLRVECATGKPLGLVQVR
ncbi:MAG TPA: hypothetical protein VM469_11395 [Pseudoxanthomonas sp.]|nr:hypothetical protein [Pseudoxanthomonas sp.]